MSFKSPLRTRPSHGCPHPSTSLWPGVLAAGEARLPPSVRTPSAKGATSPRAHTHHVVHVAAQSPVTCRARGHPHPHPAARGSAEASLPLHPSSILSLPTPLPHRCCSQEYPCTCKSSTCVSAPAPGTGPVTAPQFTVLETAFSSPFIHLLPPTLCVWGGGGWRGV